MGFLKMLLGASVLLLVGIACASPEYPTPLPTAPPFVFPSPLPTATPAPTATPIVLPSPLPTATPQAVVYPTPLPTATPAPTATPIFIALPSPLPTSTPVVLPTPLPTPTPQSFVFPTPLPTATPVVLPTLVATPTPISPGIRWSQGAFAGLNEAADGGVVSIWGSGPATGFAVQCNKPVCLLTAGHVVVTRGQQPYPTLWLPPRDFIDTVGAYDVALLKPSWTVHWRPSFVYERNKRDLAVIDEVIGFNGKIWEIAPDGYKLENGQPIRAIVIDYRLNRQRDWEGIETYILDGVVASVSADESTFMITAPSIQGNSGGVVVNEKMQVVGLIMEGYTLILPTNELHTRVGNVPAPGRTRAMHINAIRQQLREWNLLD